MVGGYQSSQQSNKYLFDVIEGLVVEADFFAEWTQMLRNAIDEAVEWKKLPDCDKWLTFPLDNVELIPREVESLTRELKAKLSASKFFQWTPRTRTRGQAPEESPKTSKTSESPEPCECGGTDFETRDEKQYCAKCALEKKP